MKKNIVQAAVGSALIAAGSLGAVAQAGENPFSGTLLSAGYQLAQADMKSMDGKARDAKCGAEKNADKKMDAKCGADKKAGAAQGSDKKKDGACGGDKKSDGKCGAAKN